MAKFSAHFGSKQDAQRVHQNTCTMLKQHLNSNCMNYGTNNTARALEMVTILQNAVDKLLSEINPAAAIGDRVVFNDTDNV